MIILDVNKLTKNFGFGVLFEDLSFSLAEGESISIVGPNGCGKSTLLKIIAGLERPDGGTINIKKGAKCFYFDQTASSIQDSRSVEQILKDSFEDIKKMEQRICDMQEKLTNDTQAADYDLTLSRYCNLLEQFQLAGGYDVDVRINQVVEGLHIDKNMLNQVYDKLSGGEKTLVQLAKALLQKPDLFLLDEPTNHLDIDRIEWLEDYIKSFRGATVIVSHDRYFLDKMSNKILSLENGNSKVYSTNYSGYLEQKQHDFEVQLAAFKDQQIAMKRLEEQIKYFAELGMAKNSSTLCDRAHSLSTQLERMKRAAIKRPIEQKKFDVEFSNIKKSSKIVFEAKDLVVKIPGGKTILNKVNINISSGDKVAFIGKNGSGKSTLIKTIMGEQDLQICGVVEVGPSVKIGYLPQIIEFLNPDASLLEYFKNEIAVDEKIARQILAGFSFYKDDVSKKVKNLSGGEKIRVKLAILLQQKINTLIFDEPTNHIDIPTKEVLEDALANFDGTLIFVSHDRYFINKFADRVYEFSDGKTTPYYGNYDYYKSQKNK
ncbi:MAG: ribosomal protection-like ABC-F family protein [Christensenellales bacterium]